MKKCKDCNQIKSETEFYGVQGECKICTRKRVHSNYLKNREHYITYEKKRWQNPERRKKALIYQKTRRLKFPGKNKARQKVNNAIRSKKLFKKPCEVCGCLKVEAHHKDYRKWLDVQWLCRKHHLMEDNKIAYPNENTH